MRRSSIQEALTSIVEEEIAKGGDHCGDLVPRPPVPKDATSVALKAAAAAPLVPKDQWKTVCFGSTPTAYVASAALVTFTDHPSGIPSQRPQGGTGEDFGTMRETVRTPSVARGLTSTSDVGWPTLPGGMVLDALNIGQEKVLGQEIPGR